MRPGSSHLAIANRKPFNHELVRSLRYSGRRTAGGLELVVPRCQATRLFTWTWNTVVPAPRRLDREYPIMERGPDGSNERGNRFDPQSDSGESGRLGNPTRLYPRQPLPEDPVSVDPFPAVFEEDRGPTSTPPAFGRGGLGPMFGPRSFGNGRIQVWGCSPGCLIASLIASVVLTLLLNAMF